MTTEQTGLEKHLERLRKEKLIKLAELEEIEREIALMEHLTSKREQRSTTTAT